MTLTLFQLQGLGHHQKGNLQVVLSWFMCDQASMCVVVTYLTRSPMWRCLGMVMTFMEVNTVVAVLVTITELKKNSVLNNFYTSQGKKKKKVFTWI